MMTCPNCGNNESRTFGGNVTDGEVSWCCEKCQHVWTHAIAEAPADVDTDGAPVAATFWCNSRLTVEGEAFRCGEYLDTFQRPHDGRHRTVTAPPCVICGGHENHRDDCSTSDATTNEAIYVWWTDDGEFEFEAASANGRSD